MSDPSPDSGQEALLPVCPHCGALLSRGFARIRPGVLVFLVYGFSWMKLVFRPDDAGSGEAVVLSSGERALSFRCAQCGMVAITRAPWTNP